jgi:CheY-like chemotaxis protein
MLFLLYSRLICEVNITIPIIAQTTYADDKDIAVNSRCNAFISMPFDKKHLLKVLSEFI